MIFLFQATELQAAATRIQAVFRGQTARGSTCDAGQILVEGWTEKKKGTGSKFLRMYAKLTEFSLTLSVTKDGSSKQKINVSNGTATVYKGGPPGFPRVDELFMELITAERKHVFRFETMEERDSWHTHMFALGSGIPAPLLLKLGDSNAVVTEEGTSTPLTYGEVLQQLAAEWDEKSPHPGDKDKPVEKFSNTLSEQTVSLNPNWMKHHSSELYCTSRHLDPIVRI